MSIEIIAKVEKETAIFMTGEAIPINVKFSTQYTRFLSFKVTLTNVKTDSPASLAWGRFVCR